MPFQRGRQLTLKTSKTFRTLLGTVCCQIYLGQTAKIGLTRSTHRLKRSIKGYIIPQVRLKQCPERYWAYEVD